MRGYSIQLGKEVLFIYAWNIHFFAYFIFPYDLTRIFERKERKGLDYEVGKKGNFVRSIKK